jgi:hypothetical protein
MDEAYLAVINEQLCYPFYYSYVASYFAVTCLHCSWSTAAVSSTKCDCHLQPRRIYRVTWPSRERLKAYLPAGLQPYLSQRTTSVYRFLDLLNHTFSFLIHLNPPFASFGNIHSFQPWKVQCWVSARIYTEGCARASCRPITDRLMPFLMTTMTTKTTNLFKVQVTCSSQFRLRILNPYQWQTHGHFTTNV